MLFFHSRRYEEKGKRMMRRGPGKIFRKRVRTIYNFDIVTMMVIVMMMTMVMMMLMKMSYDDDIMIMMVVVMRMMVMMIKSNGVYD